MPPLKKFKPVESQAAAPNPLPPPRLQAVQDGMHQTMMNGPTLSPQGQLSPPADRNGFAAAQPPPGLRSPPGPPAYTNGYAHVVGHPNVHHSQSSSTSPLTNGNSQSAEKPKPGWSASYSSYGSVQTPQLPQPASSRNPFLNSFERQPPVSYSTPNMPSPVKNRFSPSPPPSVRSTVLPSFPPTPTVNGVGTSPHLPAYSPVKQQSPPMPPVRPHSSSPAIHPPLQQNAPPSPGFSPVKQSPPRVFQRLDAKVLLPVPNLEPNGDQQNYTAPVKAATPKREGNTNSVTSSD